ncbi:hypothetical protein KSF78_0004902 [Schistosoma japonicum]|nr:hypothetical protein KSF78_0004902 [Schistosoma japonicum]
MPQDSNYVLFRYSSVVLRNLNLLNYDFGAYNVPKQIKLFVSYFKIPRKTEFMHILHFLFRTLNPEKYYSDFSTFLGPNSEVGFKNSAYRWLRILSSEFPRIISNFFATWGFPAGVGVMRLLANLSSYVLIVSNHLSPFVKRIVENNCDPEWSSFCSIRDTQLDLRRSLSYIRSEELFQRELLKGCDVLDSEVQHTLEELLKFKELVVSDADLQKYVGNVNLSSLCSDETVEPPEELIAYRIQLEKEVFTLKQQLESYLNRYKPSLLLLNNIINSLNDGKLYTLNGSDMKFLHTRNIWVPNLNGNNMEESKQVGGKLNFHLKDEWLRESQRTLRTPRFSQTYSSISEPFTSYKTRTKDDENGNFNEFPEISMGSILNEISETLPATPASVKFSQSVQISSHRSCENSPTRCNFQPNLVEESIHKLSTSPPNNGSVYDSKINLYNMKGTYKADLLHTTSSSPSSSYSVSEHYDTLCKQEEIENVQSSSKNLSKNVICADKLCDDSSSYQHLSSSSVIMTSENKALTLESIGYFKSASNMDFPVTISSSKSISKEPLNDLSNTATSILSTHTHRTSVSPNMKLNESLSRTHSYGSFNLLGKVNCF